ncbi:MAG: diguanylate cyclase [Candidatus Omnitrophica bacterium]|jgi:diguanylate cyclase (GGDEF)-like protein|nr:diguanylate cyclase [Candidatus Omnitrophota bacterium]
MSNPENVLIVDDDKIICEHLKAGLSDQGYFLVTANRGTTAIEETKKRSFNLIVLDLMLPDIQGIDLMRAISIRCPETSFIVFTGYATISSAIEALKVGAYDYIIKPFDIDHLKLVVRRSLEKQSLMVRNKELVETLAKENEQLEVIMEAYNEIGSIFRLDDLADFVTAMALKIADAERASFMLVDEKNNELVIRGAQGLIPEKANARVKIGEFVSGWVAQQGEALLIDDIDADYRFKSLSRDAARYKTRSFVSLPLKRENKVIGVMNVTDKLATTKIFTPDDLKYLSLIAHQAVTQIENIRLCEKLASLAVTDALTNVFNHRHFQEQVNVEILRAQRYNHNLSLMIVDVDHFKKYNDNYGHLEGDRILKQVANVIKQNIRQVDIICRYGGDEFVAILPFTNAKGAGVVAEKIRRMTEELDFLNQETGSLMRITVSVGIAMYQMKMSKDEFVALADRALYKAKKEGRNKVCISE